MNPQPLEKAAILVIDDDPITLTGTAAVLDKAGYICICARDSHAALKAARNLSLDLVVCDVSVDGSSGLELCRQMRSEPGMADVPWMFLSGAQIPDIIRRAHEAGGCYYLRKPFDPWVLIELVDKALWMPHLIHSRMGVSAPHAALSRGRVSSPLA
jgi:CheY-like chemotaxis protein